MIRKLVALELDFTFVNVGYFTLKQVVGIPMGKSTSPGLACILCSWNEWLFLSSLGVDRKLICGVRYMDDVFIVVLSRLGDSLSHRKAQRLYKDFECCYEEGLTLEKTEEEGGTWPFLGTLIQISYFPAFVGCPHVCKNGLTLGHGGKEVFRTFQDYCSYGPRIQKFAVIYSYLHRLRDFTSMELSIPGNLALTKLELSRKGFPESVIKKAALRFAEKAGGDWLMWVKLGLGL
jgi:hypothetical protein